MPQPDGPRREKKEPEGTSKESPLKTSCAPNFLRTPSIIRDDMPISPCAGVSALTVPE